MKNNKKKIKKNDYKFVTLIYSLIIVVVLFLTVGYSALTANMAINNISAVILPDAVVRVSNITVNSSTNGGISNSEGRTTDTIGGNIDLPNANSTITYDVQVVNAGNVEMGLFNITGLPSNLKYTMTGYTLGNVLCSDLDPTECTLGVVKTIQITIEYATNGYDINDTNFDFDMTFDFQEIHWIARIGTTKYQTLQAAVDAVATNNVEVTIVLLDDTTEHITVAQRQNIVFDIGNNTIYGLIEGKINYPIIDTEGAIKIENGVLSSNTTQGAINVKLGGSLVMTGGRIVATGTKQAIYNEGGTVLITGSAYLSNTSVDRATVHNLNNGTMTITGGTIISEKFSGVLVDSGTVIIGTKDGTVSTSAPSIRGNIYGVYNYNSSGNVSTNFKFYDGIIRGKSGAIYDGWYVNDTETGYGVIYGTETISGMAYSTATNGIIVNPVTVTFDNNDGSGITTTRTVNNNTAVGSQPRLTMQDYVFDGWYTADTGGTKINDRTIVSGNTRYYAHWIHSDDFCIAKIGDEKFDTLALAIGSINNNTQTTITLESNTSENVEVANGRNIILDLQGHTLSSPGDAAVIVNKGILRITGNGFITTNSKNTSAINNESTGNLTISDGSIMATGKRQALYNNGGTSLISGTAYLKTDAPERAAVHNLNNGTVRITGGTIVATAFSAINNVSGNMIIGVKDGTIDTTTPIIRGNDRGITNSGSFKFYDGTIMGRNSQPISGNIAEIESNSSISYSTTTVDLVTYNTAYLN